MLLGMELHDGCLQLLELGSSARVLAFEEVPCGFGLPSAMGAEAAVMVGHCVAGTFEGKPVMQEFVETHLVTELEPPDGELESEPVDIFSCCVRELVFFLKICVVVRGGCRMA